jgi:hypothetical protein
VAPGPPTPDSIERRTAPLPSATVVPQPSAAATSQAAESAPAKTPLADRAKAAAAVGAAGAAASVAPRPAPGDVQTKQTAGSSPDQLTTTLSAGGTVLRRGISVLGEAFWHGGYVSTVLGAELGAVAAMLGIPALAKTGIPEQIVRSNSPPAQADEYLIFLNDNGLWLGIWLGMTIGTFLILRLFKVTDGHWTTFLIAILAFVMLDQFLKTDLTKRLASDTSDTSVFNTMREQVAWSVAVTAILARGATRLARNRRL